MRLVFDTTLGPWTALGNTYADHVELDDPDPELVLLAGSAHAAGVISVSEGLDVAHVQSQADGEAALAAAMGEWVEPVRNEDTGAVIEAGHWDGPWLEGHLVNQELDAAERARQRSIEEAD